MKLADGQLFSLATPRIMGVINASPDSFYRPYKKLDDILQMVTDMVNGGAAIIDVGGEATSPQIDLKNSPVSVQQQLDRVLPVVEAVKQRFDVLISVDTSEPTVMREAVSQGAHMINDQRSLQISGALETVAQLSVPVCLMHFFKSKRKPGSCSLAELFDTVTFDLQERARICEAAGIDRERIMIDPGFGQGNYGKNARENYYLLSRLSELADCGWPVLVGWSRKSMIGDVLGVPPEKRLFGSIAAATLAAVNGAAIIRVHDVPETVDAIKIVNAFQQDCLT